MSELGNVQAMNAVSDLEAAANMQNDNPLSMAANMAAEAAPSVAISGKPNLAKRGADIYRNLSTEEKQALSSNSKNVHFICCLGAKKLPSTISKSTGQKDANGKLISDPQPSYVVVGFKFKTDIDLKVPSIPFQKPPHDLTKRPDPATMQFQTIPAGSEFVLTRVEAMYMLSSPELLLNGYVDYNGDPHGVQLAVKINSAFGTKAELPTPALRYSNGDMGSIKETMDYVDDGNACLPQYAEKFRDLYVSRAGARTTDGLAASKAATATLASLEIARILGIGV